MMREIKGQTALGTHGGSMNFDMGTTWSRAMELVKDNFQLLAVISGIFLLLPTLATYLFIPDIQTLLDPTADPEVMAAQMQESLGPILGVGLIAMIFQFAGYGAMVALMGPNRPTVGEAIKTGLKIVLSTFGIFLIFMIAYFIIALVIMIPITMLAGAAGAPGLAVIAVALILVMIIVLLARMSMSMPVMVLENTLNPIKAVSRSLKLTGPKQWQIVLFWGILGAAYLVIALLITGVFGVVAALAGSSFVGTLILGLANGVMGMIVAMVVCGLAVAMYDQLAGPDGADITSTFD